MSKAFLRESDFELQEELPAYAETVPLGVRNYLTAEGAARLRDELEQLIETERPKHIVDPSDVEARRELQQIDRRIRHLQQTLSSAEVVVRNGPSSCVRFGSTVTVREPGEVLARYRLVGVNEAGFEPHWISWRSPLAQALLDSKKGKTVSFIAPAGARKITVLDIE